MKKNNLYVALGGLATVVAVYVGYKVFKKKPSTFGEAVNDTKETIVKLPTDIKNSVSNVNNDTLPLKFGSRGANVEKLQRFLNTEGSYGLDVDGIFGVKTLSAVSNNQEPFDTFKTMHPTAIKGQVSIDFFNSFIKSY